MLLSDMKSQTILGALASLYHQWDKTFRDFMEGELTRTYDRDQVTEYAWQPNIGKLFDILEKFNWPVRQAEWFPLVNACRLIVNVYKHGKGRSLDELAENYPEYLKGEGYDIIPLFKELTTPNHEDLAVTDEEFEKITAAMRRFWVDFPERLFLVSN